MSADLKVMAVSIALSSTVDIGPAHPLFPLTVTGNIFGNVFGVEPSRDGRRFLTISPPNGQTTANVVPLTVVTNWTATLKK